MTVTSAALFAGCGGLKSLMKKGEVPEKSKMLIFPFDCDCQTVEISSAVTYGFISGMPKTILVMDLQGFETYLATRSIRLEEIALSNNAAPRVENSSSSAATIDALPPAPFNYSIMIRDLFTKQAARKQFYKVTGIQYIAVGRAKEKILGPLEEGNLKTAQTADVKLMDAETGEILVDDSFKQGLFEIVAPSRVGIKLANKVMNKMKDIAKEQKLKLKEEKTRAKRRRALTD